MMTSAARDDGTRIALVVPVFNEAAGLEGFHQRLGTAIAELDCEVGVLYVDDGSSDATAEIVHDIMAQDARVGLVRLSRNFGKDIALSAGLDHVDADAAICLDADLQHPPEKIHLLIAGWREGHDVVYGVRGSRRGENPARRASSFLFYRILGLSSDIRIPADAGDFRLLSRRAYEALREFRESHRFMKGLYAWIGYSQKAVMIETPERSEGTTRWRPFQLVRYAIDGITSFSIAPIRLATMVGVTTACLAFLYALWIALKTVLFGEPVPGFPTIMTAILFLGGLQLMAIGVLGEYVGRTFIEAKRRPLYLVAEYAPPGGSDRDSATDPPAAARP